MKLHTSTEMFDSLHRSVHAARVSSRYAVKVEKAALQTLLHDHSRLLAWFAQRGIRHEDSGE